MAGGKVLFILLFLSQIAPLLYAAESLILYMDTQTRSLPITSVEGQRYIALQDLLSTVGLVNEVEKSASVLQIRIGKHSLLFRPNSTLVVIDGGLTSMGDPILVMSSGWMVPVESIAKILPRLTDQKVTFSRDAPRAFVTSQPPPRLFFEATKGILSSRVALQATRAVPFEMKQDGRQLIINLGNQPLDPSAEKLSYSDDRIKSIVFDDSDSKPKLRITLSSPDLDVKASMAQEGRVFVAVISAAQQITPPVPPPPGSSLPSQPAQIPAPSGPGVAGQAKGPILPQRGVLRTVTIDAGHGGMDSGARAANNTAIEKNLTLEIAQRLRASLQQRLGLQVYMTRETDGDVTPEQRATIANTNHSDVFISLHIGFSLVQGWDGVRVYVYSSIKEAVPLPPPSPTGSKATEQLSAEQPPVVHVYFRDWMKANAANFQMNQALAELTESELSPLWTQEPSAPRLAALRPLANVLMPAVVVELGNLNSATNVKQIINPHFQAKIAAAITNAVQRFKSIYEKQGGLASPGPQPKVGLPVPPEKPDHPSPKP